MQVQDIMSSDVVCSTPETPLSLIARQMAECDCGSIPIVENDQSRRPIGIVTDRDMVLRAIAEGRNPQELCARDVMSTEVLSVQSSTDLDAALTLMEERQIRRVPVMDEAGNLCGIVAQADIAEHADAMATAEVVREISHPSIGNQGGFQGLAGL